MFAENNGKTFEENQLLLLASKLITGNFSALTQNIFSILICFYCPLWACNCCLEKSIKTYPNLKCCYKKVETKVARKNLLTIVIIILLTEENGSQFKPLYNNLLKIWVQITSGRCDFHVNGASHCFSTQVTFTCLKPVIETLE